MKKLIAIALLLTPCLAFGAETPLPLSATRTVPWNEVVSQMFGTVTQATSITTGVTINARSGVITTFSATTAGAAKSTFTVTNSAVASTSVVTASIVNYAGTYTTNGTPMVTIQSIADGTFDINLCNVHASNALSGVVKIAFHVF